MRLGNRIYQEAWTYFLLLQYYILGVCGGGRFFGVGDNGFIIGLGGDLFGVGFMWSGRVGFGIADYWFWIADFHGWCRGRGEDTCHTSNTLQGHECANSYPRNLRNPWKSAILKKILGSGGNRAYKDLTQQKATLILEILVQISDNSLHTM